MTIQFSGRVTENPNNIMIEEVLFPQLNYEVKHLLPYYIQIEKELLIEYKRMGLMEEKEIQDVLKALNQINEKMISQIAKTSMTDIAFSIEKSVEQMVERPVATWHVDRSRNDYQACAQKMLGRQQLLQVAKTSMKLASKVIELAKKNAHNPMPGYTHYQSAQVISLGFYLSAISDQLIQEIKSWIQIWDRNNYSPLGAGAMAGQELNWDREEMAVRLGFDGIEDHSLVAVASRKWSLDIGAAFANWGVMISRFVTDFIQWGSSEFHWIDLPDGLSGISSAMPQKKNFPILERVRGRTAHLTTYYMDMHMGQRNTVYSNLVEVSKEANKHVLTMFETVQSIILLMQVFFDHLQFNHESMNKPCKEEFLGGFSLANYLTLNLKIPYRKSQVIAGQYIVHAMKKKLKPAESDSNYLEDLCRDYGFPVSIESEVISNIFINEADLQNKKTVGSTQPDRVLQMLSTQEQSLNDLQIEIEKRDQRIGLVNKKLDKSLNV
ncbi:argininosuccinate lyase [Marininema mesophilum]|uniref:Argininosuccinate lyase n=1 Tax=Marininema mesophilum TaxID=1048340 RepID=A0A1H2YUS0_9BACL|nr:lyase family protein [Marininema mesophilum]SDX08805.1 argininosuccinate lyase [Marininema mesophilum]